MKKIKRIKFESEIITPEELKEFQKSIKSTAKLEEKLKKTCKTKKQTK